jgi:hypothetical protein
MNDDEKVKLWLKRIYLNGEKLKINSVLSGSLKGNFCEHKTNGNLDKINLEKQEGIQVNVAIDEGEETFYFKKEKDNTLQYVAADPSNEENCTFKSENSEPSAIESKEIENVSKYAKKMRRINNFVKTQKRIHFIFMLDQSNSIKDDGHFETIQEATKTFLKKLKKKQKQTKQKIIISVVPFSHLYQVKERGRKIEKLKLKFLDDFLGGNTNFGNPLEQSVQLYNEFKEEVDITLAYLFTDGDAEVPKNAISVWSQLLRSNKHFMQLRLVTLDRSVALKRFDRCLDTPSCIYLEKVSPEALFDNIKDFLSLS